MYYAVIVTYTNNIEFGIIISFNVYTACSRLVNHTNKKIFTKDVYNYGMRSKHIIKCYILGHITLQSRFKRMTIC